MIHKASALTSQTTMTDQLIQFMEIIAVYCENHTKHLVQHMAKCRVS